jgi:hypothetical protein
MRGVNWTRGLLRLWLIASILWVLFILGLLLNRAIEHEQSSGPIGGTYYNSWLSYLLDYNWLLLLDGPILFAVICIAAAIFIKIAAWIGKGFA